MTKFTANKHEIFQLYDNPTYSKQRISGKCQRRMWKKAHTGLSCRIRGKGRRLGANQPWRTLLDLSMMEANVCVRNRDGVKVGDPMECGVNFIEQTEIFQNGRILIRIG